MFRDLVKQQKLTDRFEIVSAGTGDWHVGERAHHSTRETLRRHGIEPNSLFAKHVSQAMIDHADYVVAMDYENLADLRACASSAKALAPSRLRLDVEVRDVPDPTYDGRFEFLYTLVNRGTEDLPEQIRETNNL